MKLFLGKRQCGKTTLLIKESMETGSHILVDTMTKAKFIYNLAKKLFPEKWETLPSVFILELPNIPEFHGKSDCNNKPGMIALRKDGETFPVDRTVQHNLLIDDYDVIASKLVRNVVGINSVIAGTASTNDVIWEIKPIVNESEVIVNTKIEKEESKNSKEPCEGKLYSDGMSEYYEAKKRLFKENPFTYEKLFKEDASTYNKDDESEEMKNHGDIIDDLILAIKFFY